MAKKVIFSTPERQSMGILDDYKTGKASFTKESYVNKLVFEDNTYMTTAVTPTAVLWDKSSTLLYPHSYATDVVLIGKNTDDSSGSKLQVNGNIKGTTLNSVVLGLGGGAISTNVAIGTGALASNDIGVNSVAIGYNALNAANNISNLSSVAIGWGALLNSTTGIQNVAIGQSALQANLIGSYNFGLGYASLQSNKGSANVAIGANALNAQTSGANNIAIGYSAMSNGVVTGSDNISIGIYSTLINTSGSYNIAFGRNVFRANTTGQYNNSIGYQAGWGDGTTTNMGSKVDNYMNFLGYQASRDASIAQATVLSNGTAIGKNARVGQSNSIILGGLGADAVSVGIGLINPSAFLHIVGTTEQLRLAYDASNYKSETISLTGSCTTALTGTSPINIFSQAVKFSGGTQANTGAAGIAATITTAALTVGGTRGSMTFIDGLLTAQTQAT